MRESYYDEYFRLDDSNWFFVARRRILLGMIDRHFARSAAPGAPQILDFGCGTGLMLQHLERYGSPQGVDVDEQAIGFCRRRGLANVQLFDGRTLPFEDGSFSLVTSLDVFEHIEDDLGAMREVARVLEPGGLLLAAVPAYQWMWGQQDEVNEHFRRYTARQLDARLAEAGFAIERSTYFNTILFPPIAAIRLGRRLMPRRGEPQSDFEGTPGGALNSLLTAIFGSESRWLRRRDLPFGVSVAAVARR
jgi:SAM-dependent methyltransferase